MAPARRGPNREAELSKEIRLWPAGYRHVIDVAGLDAGRVEAIADGAVREGDLVLLAGEPLLLHRGHQLAVHEERGGSVRVVGVDPEDDHHGSLRPDPSGARSLPLRPGGRQTSRMPSSTEGPREPLHAVPGPPGHPGSTGSLHARRSWHRRLPLHPRRAIAAFRPRPLALHRVPLLFVLGLALLSVPILLQPGRYLADTHDTLWFAPGWYLRHSLSVWQDSAFLRGQPSLAPMAAFVWALRSLGFSLWLVQRLWYGVLMATAGVGAALLVHQLHPRLPSIGALAMTA